MHPASPGRLAALAALAAAAGVAAPAPARAEVGIGVFVGEPLGLDLKLDLQRRSALDLVVGAASVRDGGRDLSYGHVTYLATLLVSRGQSVLVPVRVGIGAAVAGLVEGDATLAVRAPLELALRMRRAPVEIYGEITLKLVLVRERDAADFVDLDGGVGLRLYL
jgi:hypothetical protein